MKTLQEIKDEVAKEWFDKTIPSYELPRNWANLSYVNRSVNIDEVSNRYASQQVQEDDQKWLLRIDELNESLKRIRLKLVVLDSGELDLNTL